jgi:hypothetical protein
MAADDEVFSLLEVNDVFVFKIPATSSAAGHRAKDWTNQVWDGTLKVLQKSDKALIQLVGRDGKLFAMAPVTIDGPPAYEPVPDSSRYFVLRISDGKGALLPMPLLHLLSWHTSLRRSTHVDWPWIPGTSRGIRF